MNKIFDATNTVCYNQSFKASSFLIFNWAQKNLFFRSSVGEPSRLYASIIMLVSIYASGWFQYNY